VYPFCAGRRLPHRRRATRPGAHAKEARKLVCSNLDGTARARCDETPDKLAALADAVRALDCLGAPHAVVGGVIDRAEPLDITGVRIRVVTTVDLIAMKERSKALRDQADIALLRGDIPDPDEGW
jgi:hypothetical protein